MRRFLTGISLRDTIKGVVRDQNCKRRSGESDHVNQDDDEVTAWLHGLAMGSETSAQRLWQRDIQQMLSYARKRLAGNRRVADEEDLAVSAFHSLCHRMEQGQFPDLKDRESLWKLLTTIIARKASAEIRRNLSRKRGGGKVGGESAFFLGNSSTGGAGLGNFASPEPTPEFAAEMAEQCSRLLDCLPDDCRRIALLKLDGYSNEQIVKELNIAPRTVARKLASIRGTWQQESPSDDKE